MQSAKSKKTTMPEEITLQQYLDETGQNAEKFAELIDYHVSAVYLWLQGKRRPGPKALNLIYKITNGRVTANSFYHIKNIDEPAQTEAIHATAA